MSITIDQLQDYMERREEDCRKAAADERTRMVILRDRGDDWSHVWTTEQVLLTRANLYRELILIIETGELPCTDTPPNIATEPNEGTENRRKDEK